MKAYKGFDKNMQCRGFQFEEGKTYETEDAKLCESGFHACTDPLDVFKYYSPDTSVYHEVELDDVSKESSDDSKVCGKKITIGARIGIKGIVTAFVGLVLENTKQKTEKELHTHRIRCYSTFLDMQCDHPRRVYGTFGGIYVNIVAQKWQKINTPP